MEAYESAKAIFENNLINWVVLVFAIVYLWSKNVPQMFKSRENAIETALHDAAQAKKQGAEQLAEQERRIANAEQEKQNIITEAKNLAGQLKLQMEAQTAKDVADLRTKIEQQIANERQLAVTQLKEVAARASISLTEKALPSLLNEEAKARLLTQFMEQLDKEAGSGTTLRTGSLESSNR